MDSLVESALNRVRTIPDFPIKGILFKDLTPLYRDLTLVSDLLDKQVNEMKKRNLRIDVVVGIESRGFITGPLLAQKLNAIFVPARKQGKLPPPCVSAIYQKEYGVDTLEISSNVIWPPNNVLIHDDILATGGTALAVTELVKTFKATPYYSFLGVIKGLNGIEKLESEVFYSFDL